MQRDDERILTDRAQFLYRDLLGTQWDKLPDAIQRLHSLASSKVVRGNFRVRSSLLGRLLRMPRSGEAVPVNLIIQRHGDCEIWSRTFEEHTVVSKQFKSVAGNLQERFGILEFSLALDVNERRLIYRSVDARLRIYDVGIHLPRALRPRISAIEHVPENRSDAIHVSVEVRWPCSGLLLAYDGAIELPMK